MIDMTTFINTMKTSNPSGFEPFKTEVRYLCREGNVFLMDNHLAAAWCWLQCCQSTEQYGIIHIDRHLDLEHHPRCPKESYSKIVNQELSIYDYLNLSWKTPEIASPIQCFQWNNYLRNCRDIFPNWFNPGLFITKEPAGSVEDSFPEFRFCKFWGSREYLKSRIKSGVKWIINIDLDVFFMGKNFDDNSSKYIRQCYCDDTIRQIGRIVNSSRDNIQVVTIAMSPECCGGINNSLAVLFLLSQDIPELRDMYANLIDS